MKRVLVLLVAMTMVSCMEYEEIPYTTTSEVTDKEFVEAHSTTEMHRTYSHSQERYVSRMRTVHHPDKWRTEYTFKGKTKTIGGEEFYNKVTIGDELKIFYVEKWRVKKNGDKKSNGFRVKDVKLSI
jgi:hypothetical protein